MFLFSEHIKLADFFFRSACLTSPGHWIHSKTRPQTFQLGWESFSKQIVNQSKHLRDPQRSTPPSPHHPLPFSLGATPPAHAHTNAQMPLWITTDSALPLWIGPAASFIRRGPAKGELKVKLAGSSICWVTQTRSIRVEETCGVAPASI